VGRQACLWRIELIRERSTLFGTKQACLPADKASTPEIKLVSGVSSFSGGDQRYLAQNKLVFPQIRRARRKSSLSLAYRAYPGEINVIWHKTSLSSSR
jgi:hypothetical protein